MIVLEVRNAHEAIAKGMRLLTRVGRWNDSRAGRTLVSMDPVTTVYENPAERVIFWKKRDANPFFHFMESLWMLEGRRDVAWISRYSSNIGQFSDDGVNFHAPYGYRWRNHFAMNVSDDPEAPEYLPMDQLTMIVEQLRKNPNDRRCVLQMWSAEDDLCREGKDFPCNTHVYFRVRQGALLDMTVCNRSNDIIWGAYGANVVHMSMLHEFVARAIGLPMGSYFQISNDWHAYEDTLQKHEGVLTETYLDPYAAEEVRPYRLFSDSYEQWLEELHEFVEEGPGPGKFREPFFRRVAGPIWAAWEEFKDSDNPRRVERAREMLKSCSATDWQRACDEWLARRVK